MMSMVCPGGYTVSVLGGGGGIDYNRSHPGKGHGGRHIYLSQGGNQTPQQYWVAIDDPPWALVKLDIKSTLDR